MWEAGSLSDDEEGRSRSPGLQAVKVHLRPSPSPPPFLPPKAVSPPSARRRKRSNRRKTKPSQGDVVLLNFMSNNNRPDIAQEAGKRALDFNSGSSDSEPADSDEEMEDLDSKAAAAQSEQLSLPGLKQENASSPGLKQENGSSPGNATVIAQQVLALEMPTSSDSASQPSPSNPLESEKSPNSAKLPETDVSASEVLRGLQIDGITLQRERKNSTLSEPLKTPAEDRKPVPLWRTGESLVTSPISEHLLTSADSPAAQKLPALQPNSPPNEGPASPQTTKLPPLRNVLADIDPQPAQQRMRQQSFPPPMSGPSPGFATAATARSPPSVLPPLAHPSPVLSQSGMSPPSASGLSASGLPSSFTFSPARRASQASETSPPGYPPPLHSASTTDSFKHSSPDGYSPSNASQATSNDAPTNPAHRMSIDGVVPPILPPPPGSALQISHVPSHGTGGFKCDYPGCTAVPFQTQYLLNSHANVHSTSRPHYCPVPGCPRAEGGRGFKRKNEMIRHGLVHESPGYVCPFCPDREHKYPRPDNLQRHVRVHHVDRDRDDPKLREVLAQRPEGGSRGRRRRMT